MHWSPLRTIVNPNPSLVLFRGEFQNEQMIRQRVSEANVRAAVRHQGIASLEEVGAVVLEADGTFSVVKELADGENSAFKDIPELGGSNRENIEPTKRRSKSRATA